MGLTWIRVGWNVGFTVGVFSAFPGAGPLLAPALGASPPPRARAPFVVQAVLVAFSLPASAVAVLYVAPLLRAVTYRA